jgi:hypothetical protein
MLTRDLRNICVSINPITDIHFMRFRDSLVNFSNCGSVVALLFHVLLIPAAGLISFAAAGQTAPASVAAPIAASVPAQSVGTAWLSLTPVEQTALAPLAKHWSNLSEGQKRKWLAISKTFPGLAQPDQEKLHSRMVEWAALSPKDREVARLNFAQTKSVAKSDRAANWEAYQALSPDARKKLADDAKVKPVGAAVAVKPVAPDKLTTVPVTRHTPELERSAAAAQMPLNRTTLLPQPPASAPLASTTALPAKP